MVATQPFSYLPNHGDNLCRGEESVGPLEEYLSLESEEWVKQDTCSSNRNAVTLALGHNKSEQKEERNYMRWLNRCGDTEILQWFEDRCQSRQQDLHAVRRCSCTC